MKIYTYSKARQELAKLLEEARIDGEVPPNFCFESGLVNLSV